MRRYPPRNFGMLRQLWLKQQIASRHQFLPWRQQRLRNRLEPRHRRILIPTRRCGMVKKLLRRLLNQSHCSSSRRFFAGPPPKSFFKRHRFTVIVAGITVLVVAGIYFGLKPLTGIFLFGGNHGTPAPSPSSAPSVIESAGVQRQQEPATSGASSPSEADRKEQPLSWVVRHA